MAKFRQFEGAFSWFFIELETHSAERDICLIATAQRPNSSYNKGYIAYYYCTCAKRPYFHFRFEDVFSWFFHRKSKNSVIFLLPVYLAHWPRKRATCWAIHVDHFHQVWSWYDYPSLLVQIPYVTLWPWPLTFCPWTVVKHGWSCGQPIHQVWRSYAYPFLTYELWCPPVNNGFGATVHAPYHVTLCVRGKILPKYLKPWSRFVYSLCNPHGSTIKVNWVICQNSARPCVKDKCDVCACAKSRDLSVGGRKQ